MRGANHGADMLLKSAFGMMLVMFSDRHCESHFRSMRQRAFEVAPSRQTPARSLSRRNFAMRRKSSSGREVRVVSGRASSTSVRSSAWPLLDM